MKYDLYATLVEAGYTKIEDNHFDYHWDTITREYEGLYSPIRVEARFTQDHEFVTLRYFAGGSKGAFKTKVHASNKRAYNALMTTLFFNNVQNT